VEERRVVSGDDFPIGQLDRRPAVYSLVAFLPLLRLARSLARRVHHFPVFRSDVEIPEEKLNPLNGFGIGEAHGIFASVTEIAADHLLAGRPFDLFVVDDRIADSVHPHVSG